jgi:hypothetical protein
MKILNTIIYSFTWILNLLFVFVVFAKMSEADLSIYYNSDTMYLASIFKDVMVDHTGFKGWYINAAPNFFPDMFLYFIINGLFADFRVAYVVFSFVQYILILILLNVLLKAVKPNIRYIYLTLLNLVFPVFLLISIISGDFLYTYFLFSHSFHTGVFINFLLSLIFVFKYLQTKKPVFIGLGILISFIGIYCDRLYLVIFFFPLYATLILNLFLIKNKAVNKIAPSMIFSAFAGLYVYEMTENNSVFKCIGLYQKYMNFDNIHMSFHHLIDQHYRYIKEFSLQGLVTIIFIFNFFILIFLVYRYIRKKKPTLVKEHEFLYLSFIFISIFLSCFNPVINGYYLGAAHLRYNIFSFWLSVFNLIFFITLIKKGSKQMAYALVLILIVFYGVVFVKNATEKDFGKRMAYIASYYPENIKVIDEFAKTHHLQYGLSEYWDSKYTTMFSSQKLRVYTIVDEQLKPWYHLMNQNWYHDYSKGTYNQPIFKFVLLKRMDKLKLREFIGKPIDSLVYKNETILYVIPDIKYTNDGKPYFLNPIPSKNGS